MACSLNISELCQSVGGQIISEQSSVFKGVGTDTREDLTGQLFVALRGDNFDAHEFLAKAVDQKAAILLVDKKDKVQDLAEQVSVVLVEDTLVALQQLAHFWRAKLKAKVVALSGSNGKTTTKDFANSIIGTVFKTHTNVGSYNNHWGVPLTLLSAPLEAEVVILEMGMNHAGELLALGKIAEPEAVVVTNVGRAHIGHFKDLSEVAAAKEELYSFGQTHIFNLDNPWTEKMKSRSKVKGKMSFNSGSKKSDIHLKIGKSGVEGLHIHGRILDKESTALVSVFGEHNLENIMAACGLALAVGCTPDQIWKALPKCESSWGRSQYLISKAGFPVLFDAYNANPESFKALIKNVYKLAPKNQKKYFVVGEMLEMGDSAAKVHQELGQMLGDKMPDGVWFVGQQSEAFRAGIEQSKFDKKLVITNTYDISLASEVQGMLKSEDILVVKGSRRLRLERILEHFGQNFA